MADKRQIITLQANETGSTQINHQVIANIAQIATLDIKGVYQVQGPLSERLSKMFISKHSQGVDFSEIDGRNILTVYVLFDYGVSVPKLAQSIQTAIKDAVLNMTGLQLDLVNVDVVGIIPPKHDDVKIDQLFEKDNA